MYLIDYVVLVHTKHTNYHKMLLTKLIGRQLEFPTINQDDLDLFLNLDLTGAGIEYRTMLSNNVKKEDLEQFITKLVEKIIKLREKSLKKCQQ